MALCWLHVILRNINHLIQIYIVLHVLTSVDFVQTADLKEMNKNYETISSNTHTLVGKLESIKIDINNWITKINELNKNGLSMGNDKLIALHDRCNTLKTKFLDLERQLDNDELEADEGRDRINILESEIIELYKDYDNEQRKVDQQLASFGSLLTDITSMYKTLIEVIEGRIRMLNASEEERRAEIESIIIEALDNEDYTLAAVKLSVIYDSSVFDELIRKLYKINFDKVFYLTTIDRNYTRQIETFKIIYSEQVKDVVNLECELFKIIVFIEENLLSISTNVAPEHFRSLEEMLEDMKKSLIQSLEESHNADYPRKVKIYTTDYRFFEFVSVETSTVVLKGTLWIDPSTQIIRTCYITSVIMEQL